MVGERRITLFTILNMLVLALVGIATVYPIIYICAVSFSDSSYIAQGKVFLWPRGFNLQAYIQIFKQDQIPRAYLNTFIYTGLGTFINLFMSAIAAYPLSRKNLFGKKVFTVGIVFTMFFTGGIIPTYLVVQNLHLIDTLWAVVLPNAIWTIELLILKSFFESMSESLRESALIDGASDFRILFHIYLPLSKPALASVGLFYFMGHWNDYFYPMIYLNNPLKFPLQVVLRSMLLYTQGQENNLVDMSVLSPEALKNAVIFITMIPVLLIYPYAQKYFAKGVMLGSEKG